VCGSSAPVTRVVRYPSPKELHLCYGHEAVCTLHLQDPCPICDVEKV
jgi:hypothetical protein